MHARAAVTMVLLVACSACSKTDTSHQVNRDTLTKRQADSILGASKMPGAKGIGAAQNAADAVTSHQTATDSLPQ